MTHPGFEGWEHDQRRMITATAAKKQIGLGCSTTWN